MGDGQAGAGHQQQSTSSWQQVFVRMGSCRFTSLDTNTRSRGFLEAGAWPVEFQQAVPYSWNLLFHMLAFIKILVEGKVGVGRREEGDNMFLLAVVLHVPVLSACRAGRQRKPARCLVHVEQPEGFGWDRSGGQQPRPWHFPGFCRAVTPRGHSRAHGVTPCNDLCSCSISPACS